MTKECFYRCNLCGETIKRYMAPGMAPLDTTDRAGVSMHFTSDSQWAKFLHPRDANHHICERCIVAIRESDDLKSGITVLDKGDVK